uniref:MIT_C domain-containing protein n=1 Tax=Rhabditophanes sp. KR3021 TaxID=114890 RepID=A0AC35TZ16_9BILA
MDRGTIQSIKREMKAYIANYGRINNQTEKTFYEERMVDLSTILDDYYDEEVINIKLQIHELINTQSNKSSILKPANNTISRPSLVMCHDTPSLGNIFISKDALGYTYKGIFDKYLNTEKHNADQCTKVTIRDPFIRNPFQFQNLNLFVTYVMDTFKNLRCITVITKNINTLEELKHRKKQCLKKNEIKQKLSAKQAIFEANLSEIAQNCKQKSVSFELEINQDIHDRHILFNHGIIVSMGKGLDIFKHTKNPNDIRSNIPCCETHITFFNAFELEKSF